MTSFIEYIYIQKSEFLIESSGNVFELGVDFTWRRTHN